MREAIEAAVDAVMDAIRSEDLWAHGTPDDGMAFMAAIVTEVTLEMEALAESTGVAIP